MAKLIQAEIEYFKENDIGIHSDIEPHGCKFEDIDNDHRKFLHNCLDEWLNESNGTGCFYIKDINHKIDHYGNSK